METETRNALTAWGHSFRETKEFRWTGATEDVTGPGAASSSFPARYDALRCLEAA